MAKNYEGGKNNGRNVSQANANGKKLKKRQRTRTNKKTEQIEI